MSDELPTAARVSDPGIRALYAQENRWQAWLDVEAALAKAEAELGIIPKEAADAIAAKARLELLDRARIDEGFARTGHTIVPLVWELSRVVGEPHGGWVHWGQQPRTSPRPAICWSCARRIGRFCGRSAKRCKRWPIWPNAAPTCRSPAALTVNMRCQRPLATSRRCGSTR